MDYHRRVLERAPIHSEWPPLPEQTFSLWRFRRALNMSFPLREKVAEGRMRGG